MAGLLLSALGQAAMVFVVPRYLGHAPWTQWGAGPVVLLVVAGSPVVIGSIVMVASLQKMRKRAS